MKVSDEFDNISSTIKEQLTKTFGISAHAPQPIYSAATQSFATEVSRIEELTSILSDLGYDDTKLKEPFFNRYIVPAGSEIYVPIIQDSNWFTRPNWPRNAFEVFSTSKRVVYDYDDVLVNPMERNIVGTSPFALSLFVRDVYAFQLPDVQAAKGIPFILVHYQNVTVQNYQEFLEELVNSLTNPPPSRP